MSIVRVVVCRIGGIANNGDIILGGGFYMSKEIRPCRPAWRGSMTPRERFNRQVRLLPVDRSFNMEFGYWDENYKLWDLFKDNGITNDWEADRFFSFDRLEIVGSNVWMDPPFEYKELERRGNIIVIQNRDGLTAEVLATGNISTIPHFTASSVVTPEDWAVVKAHRFDVNSPRRIVDVDKIIEAHPPGRDYPLGVDCGSMIGRIRDMLTFEGICYAYADYPEMLEDMVETCCVLVEHFLDQVLGKVDFDFATGWEDICYAQGPILPPSFFKEVVAPRYKRISDRLKAHGIYLWWTDCDGDVRPLLPIFLEAGINCLFPFEVAHSGHPGEVLDKYEDLRILGGVDKMKMIEGKGAIKAYLESLVPYVKSGRLIPFCDHRCPPDVTPENYLYYLDLKEELFGVVRP